MPPNFIQTPKVDMWVAWARGARVGRVIHAARIRARVTLGEKEAELRKQSDGRWTVAHDGERYPVVEATQQQAWQALGEWMTGDSHRTSKNDGDDDVEQGDPEVSGR